MTDHHTPPWAPETGLAHGLIVTGITGYVTEVRAQIANGPDSFTITGLRDSTDSVRDRVRAAVVSSGLPWPGRTITVTISMAGLPGCGLDLPVAIAVLTAAGVVSSEAAGRCVMAAELDPDGSLRPVRGILAAFTAAERAGYPTGVVAPQNAAETALAAGIAAVPCATLRVVLHWLHAWRVPPAPPWYLTSPPAQMMPSAAQLAASPQVLVALQAAAAGGHHLALTGPACVAGEVADGLRLLLPDLDQSQSGEVTAIYSTAGQLGPDAQPVTRPPWRRPHHTTTLPAMLGGGSGITHPGEIPPAHHGVLYLDQAPEFSRDVLTALKPALTSGEVTISRGHRVTRFPARITLIAGLPPCPCGPRPGCACTPVMIRRYHQRVTSVLSGYLSIRVALDPADRGSDSDPQLWAAHVADARQRARDRLAGTPWHRNADIPALELTRSFHPGTEAAAVITRATDLGQVSYRGAAQVTRLAWTLTDLAGKTRPGRAQAEQALAVYLGTSS